MEWETEFVGLVMNVLPTKLAAFERLVHKCQTLETAGCDSAGDGGHAGQSVPHPEQLKDSELDTDARGNPRDHENSTVH